VVKIWGGRRSAADEPTTITGKQQFLYGNVWGGRKDMLRRKRSNETAPAEERRLSLPWKGGGSVQVSVRSEPLLKEERKADMKRKCASQEKRGLHGWGLLPRGGGGGASAMEGKGRFHRSGGGRIPPWERGRPGKKKNVFQKRLL